MLKHPSIQKSREKYILPACLGRVFNQDVIKNFWRAILPTYYKSFQIHLQARRKNFSGGRCLDFSRQIRMRQNVVPQSWSDLSYCSEGNGD